ncbi:MAG: DNA polymerase III subunit delta [Bacteroidetes bacterium]|nr:DNA polymerase III subunit delta [Bacteroidota bacterium]MBL7103127.1 DNA polymerase III subunit delta [Bacteroidales bacterium]
MKFADIIGQETVKQKLIKTVKANRVSHAQLFLGPEGSGKLALAIAYAQYINCTNKVNSDSCGECPSCVKYNKLIHPDLHFIYPVSGTKEFTKPVSVNFIAKWRELLIERNYFIGLNEWYEYIGIEKKQAIINANDCNSIIKTLSYKTYEADYKVMIIWMVEKLFHSAAPKILKILEEPPDKTLFVLISENQEQIINTILSRTQLLKIPPVDNEQLLKALIHENFEPGVVNDAVKISGGNYIEAKRLITQSEDEEFNYSRFIKWMRLCFKNNAAETVGFVSEFAKNSRERHKSFLNYALRIIRESLLINLNTNELVRLNNREADFIKKFHPYVNSKNVDLITQELNKSIYHIERNANPNVLFLDLSLKIGKLLKM